MRSVRWLEIERVTRSVARIVALRANGTSLPAIALTLTAEGRATKRGGRWTPETVRRVLGRVVDAG